jgi:hypothetical protein
MFIAVILYEFFLNHFLQPVKMNPVVNITNLAVRHNEINNIDVVKIRVRVASDRGGGAPKIFNVFFIVIGLVCS